MKNKINFVFSILTFCITIAYLFLILCDYYVAWFITCTTILLVAMTIIGLIFSIIGLLRKQNIGRNIVALIFSIIDVLLVTSLMIEIIAWLAIVL